MKIKSRERVKLVVAIGRGLGQEENWGEMRARIYHRDTGYS
jgi:hypothetical protein